MCTCQWNIWFVILPVLFFIFYLQRERKKKGERKGYWQRQRHRQTVAKSRRWIILITLDRNELSSRSRRHNLTHAQLNHELNGLSRWWQEITYVNWIIRVKCERRTTPRYATARKIPRSEAIKLSRLAVQLSRGKKKKDGKEESRKSQTWN